MSEAKNPESVGTENPPSGQVAIRRKRPLWHRQYLRRLASHGNKSRAAKESGITYRTAIRTERAHARFRKATNAALRIAEVKYVETLEHTVKDLALHGYQKPIVSGGKFVMNSRAYLPGITRHVLDTLSPTYREAKERGHQRQREQCGSLHGGTNYSVSQTVNNVSVSLTDANLDPAVRAALCLLSDALTASKQPQRTPIELSGDPPIVGRADDE